MLTSIAAENDFANRICPGGSQQAGAHLFGYWIYGGLL